MRRPTDDRAATVTHTAPHDSAGGVAVVHREAGLLVLDKPSGLSVLADRGGHSLWDLLRDEGLTPRVVHRIDKGTSGLLLVALDRSVQRDLTALFESRRVTKRYVARLTHPLAHRGTTTVDLPIVAGRKNSQRIAGPREAIACAAGPTGARYALAAGTRFEDRPGRDATTRIRSVDPDGDPTLVVATPRTGRTHQIRVHLGWLGHPLCGDALYGDRGGDGASRLALHCHRLVVPGIGGRTRTFTAPLPADFPASPAAAAPHGTGER